ncbi:ORF V: Enzymatic polyprotein [Labeo rohita]|uniref:ribonuclease H n=1 Tax=Labeo rohita TaxID=84645 RepID=A0ABQ8L6X7_LABRO|nr:ORF V: Enzymatic polyprotein [Labeo rohita]
MKSSINVRYNFYVLKAEGNSATHLNRATWAVYPLRPKFKLPHCANSDAFIISTWRGRTWKNRARRNSSASVEERLAAACGRHPTPPTSNIPTLLPQSEPRVRPVIPPSETESVYRGPPPTIPKFTRPDPSEFARLRIALENLLPPDGTELFKYQILVDHLKLEDTKMIADANLNFPTPFTDTMSALHEKYGQPHQLALRRIASVLDSPDVRRGDIPAFQRFALQVQSLVGLLRTLGHDGELELSSGSHVARLLNKLPLEQREEFHRHMFRQPGSTPNLVDFSNWLCYETSCHSYDAELMPKSSYAGKRSIAILHGVGTSSAPSSSLSPPTVESVMPRRGSVQPAKPANTKRYCPFCNASEHYLSQCTSFAQLTPDKVKTWIRSHNRCWRCARSHHAAQSDLKKPCSLCRGLHLRSLHDVNISPSPTEDSATVEKSCFTSSSSDRFYLDKPSVSGRVMLKVVPVHLSYEDRTLDTFALMDDGSERTILLSAAVEALGIQGVPEDLPLRTVRDDVQVICGRSIDFQISPVYRPQIRYQISHAFTAARLNLSRQSYPVEQLRRKYRHLRGLPIRSLTDVQPLLLIGSDQPHLITPTEPVRWGGPGAPVAVRTRLGWTLQGPVSSMGCPATPRQCLLTSLMPAQSELLHHVQKLWQLDTVPYRESKEVTRSKQDQEALQLLDCKTLTLEMEGVHRLATPLLRHKDMPLLKAPRESVLSNLRSVERRLLKDPERAETYQAEMRRLLEAGAVRVVPDPVPDTPECWYIPHHMVSHNGKSRLVFNCSHQYRGQSLNRYLLPGPTLGASLLGVLLRFREHPVAVSGDIKAMFHQVLLLPEDRPLLRFLWRDLHMDEAPQTLEWLVLPFGTTSSPCCAIYALQRHPRQHPLTDEIRLSVERCFYVDNCLQSLPTAKAAKSLIDNLRTVLSEAGFEIRQWASNDPAVLSHPPPEAQATSVELWLTQEKTDVPESTLGLSWNWQSDSLSYKHRPVIYKIPTLRNIYRVLATQYDPLGLLLPYTTCAKNKQREWDDPNLPPDLLHSWMQWEEELHFGIEGVTREVHIFSDASEQAYGAVAYLRTVDPAGQTCLSFLIACSRVTPKRVHSIPRLELCGSLVAAQLAKLLANKLTLPIHSTVLWTDSTTVLQWLKSESCRYRVFVGNRIAEIQELTDQCSWRYVGSADNPADDLTKGKSLSYLASPNRWSRGPPFLLLDPQEWPVLPTPEPSDDPTELRKSTFCGVVASPTTSSHPDRWSHSTWLDLLDATARNLRGDPNSDTVPEAADYRQAEVHVLKHVQQESFPKDYHLLESGKTVKPNSRLVALAPEMDPSNGLIRVGGRLRRVADLADSILHPIVLDSRHPVAHLIIRHYDNQQHHPGSERLFAEIRRHYWILRSQEAVRRFQHTYPECRRWRGQPSVPLMSDLPCALLQLNKPAFHSCGMDCFGPFLIKIGRRTEKCWGVLFKCLTTRAVHLDLLPSLSTDSFLMALRRFTARRGTPAQLWSDQGTNFRGGERELRASSCMPEDPVLLQSPSSPSLWWSLGEGVEAILNLKPLGYISSNVADADPVTPSSLLMGWPDGSLPPGHLPGIRDVKSLKMETFPDPGRGKPHLMTSKSIPTS